MADNVPTYYCLVCGYIGNAPGICPECGAQLMADDINLPNENDPEDEDMKYDENLLEDDDDEETDFLEEDKFDDE